MKVQHKFEEVEVHVNQILRAPEKKMRENGDNLRHRESHTQWNEAPVQSVSRKGRSIQIQLQKGRHI